MLLPEAKAPILGGVPASAAALGFAIISEHSREPRANSTSAACDIRRLFSYTVGMWDPFAPMPRMNRTLVYLGACIIAGLRLAREKQVNVRVIPTSTAIEESVDLAHEIFNRVFRRVPDRVEAK